MGPQPLARQNRRKYWLASRRMSECPQVAAAADHLYTQRTRSVYDWCMAAVRTNIEIEDGYVRAIMDRYGVRTKTAAVDMALRHLAGQPMTREEALAMQGARAIDELPADIRPPALS